MYGVSIVHPYLNSQFPSVLSGNKNEYLGQFEWDAQLHKFYRQRKAKLLERLVKEDS